jgi:hypothetical protein
MCLSQTSNTDIQKFDFKNFTYPWIDPHGWPTHMQWISPVPKSKIHLVNGRWDQRDKPDRTENQAFVGLTLEDITYASFSPDSAESAIVVLRYDSGDAPYHYWVYIYGSAHGEPNLMGFFNAGDGACNGLYRVFEKDHLLNVELFDPALQQDECCSAGYIDYQYRWNGSEFEEAAKPRKGMVDGSTRHTASILKLPIGHK